MFHQERSKYLFTLGYIKLLLTIVYQPVVLTPPSRAIQLGLFNRVVCLNLKK